MAECTPIPDVTSIELAAMARQEQGDYEMEVCFGDGEADLHVHFNSCPKNPGHPNFIPVKKFSIDHLDPFWKHPYVYESVQLLAQRTVRLVVRGASAARPSHFPFSGRQFRNARRYGTGFTIYNEKVPQSFPCSMPNCSVSGEHQEYGPIVVETAAHVVFNESEAKNTTVEFFFDEENKSGKMTARVTNFIYANAKLDRANFECVTHDVELIDKMNQLGKEADDFIVRWRKLTLSDMPFGVTSLAAIASHPHGLSKYITLGRIHLDSFLGKMDAQYETCTCPGSSGAAVLNFVDLKEGQSFQFRLAPYHYIHSGKGDNSLNKAAPTGKPSIFF